MNAKEEVRQLPDHSKETNLKEEKKYFNLNYYVFWSQRECV